jgi:F420-0:gamma-glutamyl ligase
MDKSVAFLVLSDASEDVAAAPVRRSLRIAGGQTWERVVVRTPWIVPGDDLGDVLYRHLGGLLIPDDLVIVSEKAATIALNRGVPLDSVSVGRFAAWLTRWVRPRGDSRGLSVPEKMQYVVGAVGRPRMVLATMAAALTRPVGIHGAFYVVAGHRARCMDGGRPPFAHLLLPPLERKVARDLAASLAARLGHPVAIVDINDRGGSVRAVAGGTIGSRLLRSILQDNPLGQRDARTPIGLVRRADKAVVLDVTDRIGS